MAELNLGKVKLTDDELEAKIQEVVTNMSGIGGSSSGITFDVLWKNLKPTDSFASQQVTLNKPLSDYKYWMIIYCVFTSNTSGSYSISTGLIFVGQGTILSCVVPGSGIFRRDVKYIDATTLSFGNNFKYTSLTSTSSTNANTYNVPLEVLGVK